MKQNIIWKAFSLQLLLSQISAWCMSDGVDRYPATHQGIAVARGELGSSSAQFITNLGRKDGRLFVFEMEMDDNSLKPTQSLNNSGVRLSWGRLNCDEVLLSNSNSSSNNDPAIIYNVAPIYGKSFGAADGILFIAAPNRNPQITCEPGKCPSAQRAAFSFIDIFDLNNNQSLTLAAFDTPHLGVLAAISGDTLVAYYNSSHFIILHPRILFAQIAATDFETMFRFTHENFGPVLPLSAVNTSGKALLAWPPGFIPQAITLAEGRQWLAVAGIYNNKGICQPSYLLYIISPDNNTWSLLTPTPQILFRTDANSEEENIFFADQTIDCANGPAKLLSADLSAAGYLLVGQPDIGCVWCINLTATIATTFEVSPPQWRGCQGPQDSQPGFGKSLSWGTTDTTGWFAVASNNYVNIISPNWWMNEISDNDTFREWYSVNSKLPNLFQPSTILANGLDKIIALPGIGVLALTSVNRSQVNANSLLPIWMLQDGFTYNLNNGAMKPCLPGSNFSAAASAYGSGEDNDLFAFGVCTLCTTGFYQSFAKAAVCLACNSRQFCPDGTVQPYSKENIPWNAAEANTLPDFQPDDAIKAYEELLLAYMFALVDPAVVITIIIGIIVALTGFFCIFDKTRPYVLFVVKFFVFIAVHFGPESEEKEEKVLRQATARIVRRVTGQKPGEMRDEHENPAAREDGDEEKGERRKENEERRKREGEEKGGWGTIGKGEVVGVIAPHNSSCCCWRRGKHSKQRQHAFHEKHEKDPYKIAREAFEGATILIFMVFVVTCLVVSYRFFYSYGDTTRPPLFKAHNQINSQEVLYVEEAESNTQRAFQLFAAPAFQMELIFYGYNGDCTGGGLQMQFNLSAVVLNNAPPCQGGTDICNCVFPVPANTPIGSKAAFSFSFAADENFVAVVAKLIPQASGRIFESQLGNRSFSAGPLLNATLGEVDKKTACVAEDPELDEALYCLSNSGLVRTFIKAETINPPTNFLGGNMSFYIASQTVQWTIRPVVFKTERVLADIFDSTWYWSMSSVPPGDILELNTLAQDTILWDTGYSATTTITIQISYTDSMVQNLSQRLIAGEALILTMFLGIIALHHVIGFAEHAIALTLMRLLPQAYSICCCIRYAVQKHRHGEKQNSSHRRLSPHQLQNGREQESDEVRSLRENTAICLQTKERNEDEKRKEHLSGLQTQDVELAL